MERSGPGFFEDEDNEQDLSIAEVLPPTPEEPSFLDKVKEILGLDEEEEDDDSEDEPGKKKKKGLFRRFFSKVPGVVDVDKAEESPQQTEASFSLPFLSAPESTPEESTEAPIVQPHQVEPTVVTPEQPLFNIEDEFTEEETVVELRPQHSQPHSQTEITPDEPAEEEPEPSVPDSSGHIPPMMPGGVPINQVTRTVETTPQDSDSHKEDDPHKPTIASSLGIGRPRTPHEADKRAKKREKHLKEQLEQKSKQREKKLHKKIESTKEQAAIDQEQLRRRIAELSAHQERPPYIRPEKPPTPAVEKPKVMPPQPQSPRPQFETQPFKVEEQTQQLEQQPPRPLEQERRFEVKDEPTQLPTTYSQPVPHSQPQQQPAITPPLVPQPVSPPPAPVQTGKPARSAMNQAYTTAVVSGVAVAAVFLAIILTIATLIR